MSIIPKKQILCYGDSNTWGYIPESGSRYPLNKRWPGVLRQHLGNDYFVIEYGINGRSAYDLMPPGDERNGEEQLKNYLSQYPTPAITSIMLGTNDLLNHKSLSVRKIAEKLIQLAGYIQQKNKALQSSGVVVLISPPPIYPQIEPAYYYENEIKKSQELSSHILELAIQSDIPFINAADVVMGSQEDGIHLNGESHTKLGKFIYEEFHRLSLI